SLRDCHGVVIAGLNEWMNGCMSVVDRSYFSYQVAAGRMTSECNVWLVIRKSRVTTRSIFPSGDSSRHLTSFGRNPSGVSSAPTVLSTPRRCLRKYCSPFALEDRKSTRLNSSHVSISYAVFCL